MVTNTNSAVFHAVADSVRRRILDRLRRGPAETGRIAREFPVSRPAVSKHLRVLADAGLVRGKRTGRSRVYSLAAGPLRRIEEWLAPYREVWENPESAKAPPETGGGEGSPASKSSRERSSSRGRSRRRPGGHRGS